MLAFDVADPVMRHDVLLFPAAPPAILARLRKETRSEHEALEEVLDLMATSLTLEGYRQRLEKFYGFYAPLEVALQASLGKPASASGEAFFSTATRASLAERLSKTSHLQQDLHALGVATPKLPRCTDLPPLATQAEVLGCMYVLEGATLGGRMITQHVRATLGITPATGGSFFEGYGAGTAKMWQAMRQMLVKGAPDLQSENSIVANAIATFAAMRCWCQSAQLPIATEATAHA
jgi:heme oxygenase (biliverdin-IX-beta and delta-forming)